MYTVVKSVGQLILKPGLRTGLEKPYSLFQGYDPLKLFTSSKARIVPQAAILRKFIGIHLLYMMLRFHFLNFPLALFLLPPLSFSCSCTLRDKGLFPLP